MQFGKQCINITISDQINLLWFKKIYTVHKEMEPWDLEGIEDLLHHVYPERELTDK